jgi:hypothetical protein
MQQETSNTAVDPLFFQLLEYLLSLDPISQLPIGALSILNWVHEHQPINHTLPTHVAVVNKYLAEFSRCGYIETIEAPVSSLSPLPMVIDIHPAKIRVDLIQQSKTLMKWPRLLPYSTPTAKSGSASWQVPVEKTTTKALKSSKRSLNSLERPPKKPTSTVVMEMDFGSETLTFLQRVQYASSLRALKLLYEPTTMDRLRAQLLMNRLPAMCLNTIKSCNRLFCSHIFSDRCRSHRLLRQQSNQQDPEYTHIDHLKPSLPSICDHLHFDQIVPSSLARDLGMCVYLRLEHMNRRCDYIHPTLCLDRQKEKHWVRQLVDTAVKSHTYWIRRIKELCSTIHMDDSVDWTSRRPEWMLMTGRPILNPDAVMPPQWLQADVKTFDFSLLTNVSVVMADPPWAIGITVRCFSIVFMYIYHALNNKCLFCLR